MHAMVLGLEAIIFQGNMVTCKNRLVIFGVPSVKFKTHVKPLAMQSAMHVFICCAIACVAYMAKVMHVFMGCHGMCYL